MANLRSALLLLSVVGCADPAGSRPAPGTDSTTTVTTPTPPTAVTTDDGSIEAPFLWAPLLLEGAPDLGHVPADVASADEPGALWFSEVSSEAGLGSSVAGGAGFGVGLAFADVDEDGWDDLLVVNGEAPSGSWESALWRNRGDGTFEDVTAASGIGAALGGLDGYSAAAGDIDADGHVDLYVGAHPRDVLLLGDGTGAFTGATDEAGAGGPESAGNPLTLASKIVSLGDYDADGWLDLLSASDTFVDPGPKGYLLRGLGGTFADVTAETGFFSPVEGTPCAVLWTDQDSDSHQDVAIWSDLGDPAENRVLLRTDGASFADVTAAVGWTNAVSNPMGIDSADLNGDGWPDYFVGNTGRALLLLSTGAGTYLDAALAAGIDTDNAWGLGFEDLDADGWWDVWVAQSGADDDLVFRNERTDPVSFSTRSLDHIYTFPANVAAAFADYDHDGDVDVATAGVSGKHVELFRNDTDRGTNRWLEVRVDAGPGGARGAVSARVVVGVGDRVLWRDVTGGSSRNSQNALSARFGLGQRTGAEWVGVLWPNGEQRVATNVPGDSVLVFTEAGPVVR